MDIGNGDANNCGLKKRKIKDDNEDENKQKIAKNMDLPKRIRIGSRKSQLALFQANFVKDLLKEKFPEIKYDIVPMSTTGDKILNVPLSKIGEKSLFTKELEIALENDEVDVIVHSLKDLPTTLPPGMVIGGICRRESPFDAVVFSPKNEGSSLEKLPKGSVIGTSSLRRIAQLKRSYPHLTFQSIRGNLNTRFRKLDEENTYDAIVLAVAGLERMDLNHRISNVLPSNVCMYAVGQGALAVECKEDYATMLNILSEITDSETVYSCIAERSFMRRLEGGCSVPVAVCTDIIDNTLKLQGGVFSLDGSENIIDSIEAQLEEVNTNNGNCVKHKVFCGISASHMCQPLLRIAEKVGEDLAEAFLNQGAEKILSEARVQNGNS